MISAIVAHSLNYAIGRANTLPWKMSSDLKNFKKLTFGKTIVMGRKTFDSIGFALPGRKTIVLTRDKNFVAQDVLVFHELSKLLDYAKDHDIIVCGGAEIYKTLLPSIQTFYISCIHTVIENGDAFFQKLSEEEWIKVQTESFTRRENDDFTWDFSIWERK